MDLIKKNKYNHIRPYIDFGNLNGPEGNAFIVNGRATKKLREIGLKYEIEELSFLLYNFTPNYETSFEKISFYLNISPPPKQLNINDLLMGSMEGETVNFSISKKDLIKNQEDIFNYNQSFLIDNSFDENGFNYLGRNKLFYMTNLNLLKTISKDRLIELSNQKDLCNSSPLMHIIKDIDMNNLNIFSYILDEHLELIDFKSVDDFGRNFFTQFENFKIEKLLQDKKYNELFEVKYIIEKLKLSHPEIINEVKLKNKTINFFENKDLVKEIMNIGMSYQDKKLETLLNTKMIELEKKLILNNITIEQNNKLKVNKI